MALSFLLVSSPKWLEIEIIVFPLIVNGTLSALRLLSFLLGSRIQRQIFMSKPIIGAVLLEVSTSITILSDTVNRGNFLLVRLRLITSSPTFKALSRREIEQRQNAAFLCLLLPSQIPTSVSSSFLPSTPI